MVAQKDCNSLQSFEYTSHLSITKHERFAIREMLSTARIANRPWSPIREFLKILIMIYGWTSSKGPCNKVDSRERAATWTIFSKFGPRKTCKKQMFHASLNFFLPDAIFWGHFILFASSVPGL